MKPAAFELVRASSVAEAIRCLSASEGMARVMAGGQSLMPMLNLRLAAAAQIIDLSKIEELNTVEVDGELATYGARITHAQFEDGDVLDVTRGLMRKVASGIAYRAVRNRGTLAGSIALCDPSADWVSTMLALDAQVEIVNSERTRVESVRDFVLGAYTTTLEDDELIRSVKVPVLPSDACWGFFKSSRKLGEFAQSLAVAVAIPSKNYQRVVVGATDGAPVLLDGVATLLQGAVQAAGKESSRATVYELARQELKDAGLEDDFLIDLHAASVVTAFTEAAKNESNNKPDA